RALRARHERERLRPGGRQQGVAQRRGRAGGHAVAARGGRGRRARGQVPREDALLGDVAGVAHEECYLRLGPRREVPLEVKAEVVARREADGALRAAGEVLAGPRDGDGDRTRRSPGCERSVAARRLHEAGKPSVRRWTVSGALPRLSRRTGSVEPSLGRSDTSRAGRRGTSMLPCAAWTLPSAST